MKQLILFIAVTTFNIQLFACDYCNCYLSLNPQYKKNLVGLRYTAASLEGSHHDPVDLSLMGLKNNDFQEIRSDYEIHGQFFPTSGLQIIVSMPYVVNKESVSGEGIAAEVNSANTHTHEDILPGESYTIHSGIGDPLIISHYQIVNKTGEDSTDYRFRILAGAGIRIPLGKWKLDENEIPEERSHLPGTGSLGYLASIRFFSQYKNIGLNVNSNYLFTTTNNQAYRYSNRLNTNLTLLYFINKEKLSFYPNVGSFYELSGRDLDQNLRVMNSGGQLLFAHAGIDLYWGNISLNTAFQIPLLQKLNGYQPENNFRIITGVTYSFN